jgi:hypothetical protein
MGPGGGLGPDRDWSRGLDTQRIPSDYRRNGVSEGDDDDE